MSDPRTADATPSSLWLPRDGGGTLRLAGDWRAASMDRLVSPPDSLRGGSVQVDAAGLTAWDSLFAAALWDRLARLQQRGVSIEFGALPEGLRSVLEQAMSPQTLAVSGGGGSTGSAGDAAPGWAPVAAIDRRLRALGQGLQAWWADALTTATFLGEVLLSLGRLLRGRSDMRAADLLRQIDQTGPLSLPIVTLTCFLVGLMLAYMGGAQLDRIGAQALIADVVTVGMVREMAGLMTGVILSGRLGAAFAAQLASMQANEEIDALRALGVDPVGYLVLPRLLALLLVAPPLLAFASLVGVLAGLPAAAAIYGVPPAEYLDKCLNAMTWTHLWIGQFKGTLYAALVALAGCREGLYAGRDAQSVGAATTAAVVKALVWIVMAASGTTVMFQSLGL